MGETHMTLGEAIILIPDWFQLYFIENKGAAFGMQYRHAGNDGLGQAAFGSFPDRHGRRTDLADSPFHAQKRPKEC